MLPSGYLAPPQCGTIAVSAPDASARME
jgi:hypothetical protein